MSTQIAPDEVARTRATSLRRLAQDRSVLAGVILLTALLGALLAVPWLPLADPTMVDAPNRLAGPSLQHLAGTDMLGRDMLSRLLHGGRTSVATALVVTTGITLLGLLFGVTAGMLGGVVDTLIMRAVDVLSALPTLLVAMVVLGVFGSGIDKLVLTVTLLGWPGYARVMRGATLVLREQDYVGAARAVGASRLRIMCRHIVPNLLAPVTVLSTLDVGRILLALTALSFLGFGVQPPDPEWGAMMADARNNFYSAPRLLIYPGAAISLLVLAVNLCGDGLRDALDARVSQS
jgi:peptide/nickel transport system permease protein